MPDIAVVNNEADAQYEALLDGELAFAAYEPRGSTIVFMHTEVPEQMEGSGVGSALARFALDDARGRGLAVVPLGPFIGAYIRRHPEYLGAVDEAHRERVMAGNGQ